MSSISSIIKNRSKLSESNKKGFSLAEILISMLVLSGAISTMFIGFDTSSNLDNYSRFSTESAYLAEREMELLKSDLLNGKQPPGPANSGSRFSLKPGWGLKTIWTAPDETETIRINCVVKKGEQQFKLETFLYLPGGIRQ
ncbi:MAG: type IV pilus modification PilV family protein [Candidatus Rifleibacteriota bacterium]